jgi:hypothetical protein
LLRGNDDIDLDNSIFDLECEEKNIGLKVHDECKSALYSLPLVAHIKDELCSILCSNDGLYENVLLLDQFNSLDRSETHSVLNCSSSLEIFIEANQLNTMVTAQTNQDDNNNDATSIEYLNVVRQNTDKLSFFPSLIAINSSSRSENNAGCILKYENGVFYDKNVSSHNSHNENWNETFSSSRSENFI